MRKLGPGPGKYLLPSTLGCSNHDPRREKLPCFTIGRRIQSQKETVGPGPANYTLGKCTRYGKEPERGYIGERIYLQFESQTPAPNAYSLPSTNNYRKKQPSYPIGKRLKRHGDSANPAPNAYNVPTIIGSKNNVISVPKAPAFTIRRRITQATTSEIPGPKYYPQDCSKCKLLPTFKSRPKVQIKSITPGPNHYNLQSFHPGKSCPAYTMRSKCIDFTDS